MFISTIAICVVIIFTIIGTYQFSIHSEIICKQYVKQRNLININKHDLLKYGTRKYDVNGNKELIIKLWIVHSFCTDHRSR